MPTSPPHSSWTRDTAGHSAIPGPDTTYPYDSGTPPIHTGGFESGGTGATLPPPPRDTAVCFAPGTRVATPAGDRLIEELRVGDAVLAWDGRASGPARIRRLHPGVTMVLVTFRTASSTVSGATPRHPVHVEGRGWVAAEVLRPGDRVRVWVRVGEPVVEPILETGRREGTAWVTNLTLDRPGAFFADRVAVDQKRLVAEQPRALATAALVFALACGPTDKPADREGPSPIETDTDTDADSDTDWIGETATSPPPSTTEGTWLPPTTTPEYC